MEEYHNPFRLNKNTDDETPEASSPDRSPVNEPIEEAHEMPEAVEDAVEDVVEDVVEDHGIEVLGPDSKLTSAVSAALRARGHHHKVLSSHHDLVGGKPIINCGDDWDAFVEAKRVNEASLALVLQLSTAPFNSSDVPYGTGSINLLYDMEDEDHDELVENGLSQLGL